MNSVKKSLLSLAPNNFLFFKQTVSLTNQLWNVWQMIEKTKPVLHSAMGKNGRISCMWKSVVWLLKSIFLCPRMVWESYLMAPIFLVLMYVCTHYVNKLFSTLNGQIHFTAKTNRITDLFFLHRRFCCELHNNKLILIHSYFPNGCEVDITIKEDFPEDKLVEFIDAFAEVNCQDIFINAWGRYFTNVATDTQ